MTSRVRSPIRPADPPSTHIVETHISTLLFAGDRVYKLLKPVRTAFLDHADTERRLLSISNEYELNRRLAPDVYLGLGDLYENGTVADRVLVMRRLPSDRRLSSLIDSPAFPDHLRAVARAVTVFHASLEPVRSRVPMASAAGLAALWTSSFDDIARHVGSIIDARDFDEARQLALDYLHHSEPLFQRRRKSGMVRDVHGDLIAGDIFVLDDGPRILDCLAFDDAYRVSDVLADIAFLVMDVEFLAGSDVARRLMAWYCEYAGEHHPASLAHHYVAYRAHVRAKVALMRHDQGDADAAALARRHHDQALDHLRRARRRIVLIGGGPGSGKTTTANALAERLNWSVIDSDTLRKDLRNIDHDDHDVASHPELYAPGATKATYRRLLVHAELLLIAGESVVIDATWSDDEHRRAVRALAERYGATLTELECLVEPDVARERIAGRLVVGGDPSDATPELVDRMERDPWPEARPLVTSRRPEHVVTDALEAVFGSRPVARQYETSP